MHEYFVLEMNKNRCEKNKKHSTYSVYGIQDLIDNPEIISKK